MFFCVLVNMRPLFVFFFSSRRRHTRSYGDWSSDVCSSDLMIEPSGIRPWRVAPRPRTASSVARRSEERRVGKECRARGAPYHEKKKKHETMLPRSQRGKHIFVAMNNDKGHMR